MIIVDDKKLIQNILSGTNREAQETFFNTYQKIIKDYLKHKYPKYNSDDIDDCVSDILIRVFYSLNKYDSEKSNLKTWVLAIAKNYMIDRNRKNCINTGNTNTISSEILYSAKTSELTGILADYNASTTSYCNNTYTANCSGNLSFISSGTDCTDFENCNSVNYITSQLSPSDYTLLNMKYVQGYNYCEIGKEFQLSSSTVSNKINYIKTKLKKCLLEEMCD